MVDQAAVAVADAHHFQITQRTVRIVFVVVGVEGRAQEGRIIASDFGRQKFTCVREPGSDVAIAPAFDGVGTVGLVAGQGCDSPAGVIAGDLETVSIGIGAADELPAQKRVGAGEIAEANGFPGEVSVDELASFARDLIRAPCVGLIDCSADGRLAKVADGRTIPGELNVLQIGAVATDQN